jgi:tRNA(Ile)-lysidine synthase
VDGGRLCFSVSWEAGQTWTAIDLPVPGDAELPDGRHLRAERLSGERLSLERIRQDAPGVVYLNWEAVRPPLRVRLPRPGDALEPLGMSGHQKLQDFFVNARVPRLQRRRVPLVEDQERILWVVGLRMAEPVKIVPGTAEILRLSLVGGRGMPPGCSAPSG